MAFVRLSDLKEMNPIFFKHSNMKAWGSHVSGNQVYGGRWIIIYDGNAKDANKEPYGIWEAKGELNDISIVTRRPTLGQARTVAKKLSRYRKYEAGSNLVDLHVDLDDNLVISIADRKGAREEIRDISENKQDYVRIGITWKWVPAKRVNVWADVLEHVFCNSEYEWVRPSETGDLTSSPLIGFGADRDDEGELKKLERHWWYRNYQISDWVEDLLRDGSVTFHKD